ncbi:MAG: ADP-ribosylglycohydrolase family protein, partial [Anaerolineae bacterium]
MSCSQCYQQIESQLPTGTPSGAAGDHRGGLHCPRCGQFTTPGKPHRCTSGSASVRERLLDALREMGQSRAAAFVQRYGLNAFRERVLSLKENRPAFEELAERVGGAPPSQPVDLPRRPGGPARGSAEFVDRCRGMMVGMGLGDALGYRVEFNQPETLWNEYGLWGICTPPLRGGRMLYTDDTQMAVYLARGLLRSRAEGDDWHAAVADEFVTWLRDPENNRAPGGTCLSGCRALERGVPWD